MTALYGQIEISCSSDTGGEFTNTQSSDIPFKFTPSGSYSVASCLPNCTAAGMKDFKYQSVMKYPKNTSFAWFDTVLYTVWANWVAYGD